MKTTIKLTLIYMGFQLLAGVLALALTYGYSLIKYGNVDNAENMSLVPTMLLGFIFMGIYLWKAGYISTEKINWSPISPLYLLYTVILYGAAMPLIDFIMSLMPWLPNILESTFDVLQSGWLGIICIAVLGPILEELLFRGAATKALLRHYSPGKAIFLSALVFGIFHLNPVQIVTAFLIGLILGWIYYKTASLIPCILIHILNNSLSVYLNVHYAEIEYTQDLFANSSTYYLVLWLAIAVFVGMFLVMNRITIPYPWKKDRIEEQV